MTPSRAIGAVTLLAAALLAAPARSAPVPAAAQDAAARADALVRDFVFRELALRPVTASAAGYHEHQGVRLDGRWDDYSPAGIAKLRSFTLQVQHRLAALQGAALDPERRTDLDLIRDAAALDRLELERIQDYRHDPMTYVELVGNGLYTPYVLGYAPIEQRYRDLIERLQRLPELLAQAMANLRDAPEPWNRLAREGNDANIALVDHALRDAAPAALQAAYADAAGPALQALHDFSDFLATTLAGKTRDWRLGKDDYERKCALLLGTAQDTAQLLAGAEADLAVTRAELARLAAPRSIADVLADQAARHGSAETFVDEVRGALVQAATFVRAHDLLAFGDLADLAVVETPAYMRASFPVAGFNPAPPLEPRLGAYFWVTPIPADWPPERIESKLREYNRYGLQQLAIHEAMPGHYVQFEYANRIGPPARRALRSVWGNGAYVEGWALYAQQLMTDAGYLDHDPGLRIALLKWRLRAQANAIIDIRLQTGGMSEQEALDFMVDQAYEEREEAAEKLQRAQLSSCQLATYYAGLHGWEQARDRFRARHATSYTLRSFHERALAEGAVPFAMLDRLLR
jgi:uncharacterized protein (DUF885 family)